MQVWHRAGVPGLESIPKPEDHRMRAARFLTPLRPDQRTLPVCVASTPMSSPQAGASPGPAAGSRHLTGGRRRPVLQSPALETAPVSDRTASSRLHHPAWRGASLRAGTHWRLALPDSTRTDIVRHAPLIRRPAGSDGHGQIQQVPAGIGPSPRRIASNPERFHRGQSDPSRSEWGGSGQSRQMSGEPRRCIRIREAAWPSRAP